MYGHGVEKLGCMTPIFLHAIRRYCSRSHYQVLGVKQTATTDDIRSAFLDQSKKVHPDLNTNDPATHDKFVRLNEAYSILSKAASRHDYDHNLVSIKYRTPSGRPPSHRPASTHSDRGERAFWDETIWHMRDKSQDKFYENKPYYGIKGIERVSNSVIVYGCVVIIIVGAVIHYFAIKTSASLHRSALDEKGRKNLAIYNKARQTARENGVALQLDLLKARMMNNDPTKKDASDQKR